jgi:hypothetical protein
MQPLEPDALHPAGRSLLVACHELDSRTHRHEPLVWMQLREVLHQALRLGEAEVAEHDVGVGSVENTPQRSQEEGSTVLRPVPRR